MPIHDHNLDPLPRKASPRAMLSQAAETFVFLGEEYGKSLREFDCDPSGLNRNRLVSARENCRRAHQALHDLANEIYASVEDFAKARVE